MVLMFGLMGTLTLGLTNTGHELYDEVVSWATSSLRYTEPAAPARPQVLVITKNRDDQTLVALIVNPRGYQVVVAENAARGSEILRSEAGLIAAVVLDTNMLGADNIAAMARSLVPMVRLIRLDPDHTPLDVSKPLVDAI
ncbi:MAG TPA: hypothetical protein VME43_12360 [Bryobacteraceae bacterium]|nr:hypothetical protein [Bryobacteraceae bacterium]